VLRKRVDESGAGGYGIASLAIGGGLRAVGIEQAPGETVTGVVAQLL